MTRARDLADQADGIIVGDLNVSGGTIKLDGNYPVGTGNVALGDTALSSGSLSGGYNVAMGAAALSSNTTGSVNAAYGGSALYANVSGQENTALGVNAMTYNQSGSYNVAVGRSALSANTTASNNTAVGYHAGYVNTTGQYNTFLGYKSGLNNTTANSNTYVGVFAGEFGTGISNTYVGESTGYAITTGTKNTIIGRYSGNQGGLDIRTSSNNIVLSDGDGNPRMFYKNSTINWNIETPAASNNALIVHNTTGSSPYGIQIDHDSDINNSSNWFIHAIGDTTSRFKVFTNGNVANTNNGYGSLSDVKLKENIIDASSQWDDIKNLTVRKYSMKADNLDAPNMLGVIAQEVEAAGMGGLVYESPDQDAEMNDLGTVTKQVNYSILYMKAVKALQEAMTRIETLEAKVTALEGN